jgi:hypothetical protein
MFDVIDDRVCLGLLSSRRYAKAESAVGTSAVLEMLRTNLGG